ncbi:MAG TPA: hypothetical protein VF131_11070 [Blastocatellia bacterium]|nr:hypothetical protein [Blastocatellia bacterium]
MILQKKLIRPALVSLALFVLWCSPAYAQSGRTKQTARPAPIKEATAVSSQPKEKPAEEQKPAASQDAPSLKETLDWLREKLEAEGGFDDKDSKISTKFSSVMTEGCTLRYTMTTRFYSPVDRAAGTGGGKRREITFQLRDIDLSSIKVETWIGGAYSVAVVTIDSKPKINLGDELSAKTGVYFQEEEMAGRFAKALAHAIKLCQEKKEPF